MKKGNKEGASLIGREIIIKLGENISNKY